MPSKDGLNEPSIRAATSSLQAAATIASLEVLSKVIDTWNHAHCPDCFALWLETFQRKLATGQLVIIYLPEDENPHEPEKGID